MKRQTAAITVLNRLRNFGCLSAGQSEQINKLIQNDRSIESFNRLYSIAKDHDWGVGWNKYWKNNVIIGWYGKLTTKHPLRLAALEIENNDACYKEIANLPMDSMLKCMLPDAVSRVFAGFGLCPKPEFDVKQKLTLLQRIGFDRRESPFVERWKWSKGGGYAVLSDEGRMPIDKNLVLFRSIENIIAAHHEFPQSLRDRLQNQSEEQNRIGSVQKLDSIAAMITDLFSFYGFGKQKHKDSDVFSVFESASGQIVKLWQIY